MHCDNQSAIDLSKNTMYHARTKHIDVRYHWIRKAIEDQLFQIRNIHIDENTDNMMTMVITKEKLAQCIKNTGHELQLRSQEDSQVYSFVACV